MDDIRINELPENVQNAIIATMSKKGIEITDDLREDFGNGLLVDLADIIGVKAVEYYASFYEDDDYELVEEDEEIVEENEEDEIERLKNEIRQKEKEADLFLSGKANKSIWDGRETFQNEICMQRVIYKKLKEEQGEVAAEEFKKNFMGFENLSDEAKKQAFYPDMDLEPLYRL